MRQILFLSYLLLSTVAFSQNVQVDSDTYTPQQLIEDILIDSDCINNVVVTNVSGGNFNSADESYGYFNATGTAFPFQEGIVLSTGRLSNVQGPNNSLSDDDATGWAGDIDLENALQESNTINATILEFDFTSVASQISFRYLFASEEYQEGDSNTCQYSDLFGFLIRPVGNQDYTNIALVPTTETPVKVTTVHPGIPGSCGAINEAYFGSWNDANAPINFNGQTAVLTATANVTPNITYHVKLVIADEQNYRYDSAVFLEAGSFQIATDIGTDLLISSNTAICENETTILNAFNSNATAYKWFKDGVELTSEINETYTVTEAGTYNVEVSLNNTCLSEGEITIEYTALPVPSDAVLVECDQNQDGLTFYNLNTAIPEITNNDNSIAVTNFYLTENDAINTTNEIINVDNFENTVAFQTVFARVENQNGCFTTAELELQISNNILNIPEATACDGAITDGFSEFNLDDITDSFLDQIPTNAVVSYYETEQDTYNETNVLANTYSNTSAYFQTIFVKVTSNNQCYSISTVDLSILYTPLLEADETVVYCLDAFPETVTLYGGVLNDLPNNYYYQWFFNGNTTTVNTLFNDVNEIGVYTVIVTDPNGCSSSRDITVVPSEVAIIDDISVVQNGNNNNTVTISIENTTQFEYAIDTDADYQDSQVFTNIPAGFHTIYIRNLDGCGITEDIISVIGFPKYFSPNNDGYHDTWKVSGVNDTFYQDIQIKIFDRYGKILHQQDYLSIGWDGTLNGYDLPVTDYWFSATWGNGKTYSGHFSLIR
ncbi:choice-of-anchor L domain-containing protein [Lacinutrix undariae]